MIVVGIALGAIAALIHIYIFYLESIAWTGEKARQTFGITSSEEAQTTRSLAFNQGFYNLFLAVSVLVGGAFVAAGSLPIGATLVFTGTASMVLAAAVLFISSPAHRIAALKQGVIPLLSIIALAIGVVG